MANFVAKKIASWLKLDADQMSSLPKCSDPGADQLQRLIKEGAKLLIPWDVFAREIGYCPPSEPLTEPKRLKSFCNELSIGEARVLSTDEMTTFQMLTICDKTARLMIKEPEWFPPLVWKSLPPSLGGTTKKFESFNELH